jgi:hypothetical protein
MVVIRKIKITSAHRKWTKGNTLCCWWTCKLKQLASPQKITNRATIWSRK